MGLRDLFGMSTDDRVAQAEFRITELERQVAFLLEQQGIGPDQVPGPDLTAVHAELAAGRKIDAIKAYRAATGAGLAEAKTAVEALTPATPV